MSIKETLYYKNNQEHSFSFSEESISSDGAVVLLEKIDRKHKIIKGLSNILPDQRDANKATHSVYAFLKQRVFLMAQGYEDCNDCDYLRNDPIIKSVLGGDLVSQPTQSRFENSVSFRDVFAISKYMIDQYVDTICSSRKIIEIDVDGTDDKTYGAQQLSMFNGYYRHHIYNQLLFHDGDTGQIILPVLRPGNAHSNRWFVRILREIVRAIKKKHPQIKILIRGDCGFSCADFYEYADKEDLLFCIGLPANNVLKDITALTRNVIERKYAKEDAKFQYFTTGFDYQAQSWKKEQRCYAKIESTGKGMNVRYFCSNIPDHTGQEIYQEIYVKRGESSENRIKEVKNMCHADRLSCQRFSANFLRLIISCLAYELLRLLRTYIQETTVTKAKKWQIDNIRLYVLKVGAIIHETTRRVYIKFSKSYVCADLFSQLNALI